jgi:hypothetical protein
LILNTLFTYGVNYKAKNSDNKKPMEIASEINDFESICMMFDYIHMKKLEKAIRSIDLCSKLITQIQNFYIEMKWEVKVPLLSYFCPSDTCKIYKFGNKIRLDYSFKKFRRLKTTRSPSSYIFNGEKFLQVDWKEGTCYNPLEPLTDDEKLLIIKDIMSKYRLTGDIKFKNCQIKPSGNGKSITHEKVGQYKCLKYDLQLTSVFAIQNKTKIDYKKLHKHTYFDGSKQLDKQIQLIADSSEIKRSLEKHMNNKKHSIKKELLDPKEKTHNAKVWIAENFPLKSSVIYDIFKSLQDANELTNQLKTFLHRDEVKRIISYNGFPVKIKIPVNFFVDVCISFHGYKELPPNFDTTIFDIPSNIRYISRKAAMNLKDNPKKRMAFVNY